MSSGLDLEQARQTAGRAALEVGAVLLREHSAPKRVNSSSQYDIKLELDVRCQKLIERTLQRAFPDTEFLGEEGAAGTPNAIYRWVVDPIDGTVNFAYGIPHACVSIALQRRLEPQQRSKSAKSTRTGAGLRGGSAPYPDGYQTEVGVVYDPFTHELWTAVRGKRALLNGKAIHVSNRRTLKEAIVSIGFAKSRENLEATLPYFNQLAYRVRKVRMMGAAALALTYVASGRFDAYIERGIRLWDIAAGGLIVECAGGEFWRQPVAGDQTYRMLASNGLLRRQLSVPDWHASRRAGLVRGRLLQGNHAPTTREL